jgi:hypothetical protein
MSEANSRLNWRLAVRKAFIQPVPFCPWFDRLYLIAYFCDNLRRLPGQYLFNDQLFWLRWRGELLDPLRQLVTDKALIKEFVRARLGEDYVIRTLAVLETDEQIKEYDFPLQCVVKPTHGCGAVLFCRDGIVDKTLVTSWLRLNHYRATREQNHAFLRPRILVEEYAFGGDTIPDDYKVFCVDGLPKAICVVRDRYGQPTVAFHDTHWTIQPFWEKYPIADALPPPENLEQMLAAATELSRDFPLVRVDLYSNGSAIKVGEITHLHDGGGGRFSPSSGEAAFSTLLFGAPCSIRGPKRASTRS